MFKPFQKQYANSGVSTNIRRGEGMGKLWARCTTHVIKPQERICLQSLCGRCDTVFIPDDPSFAKLRVALRVNEGLQSTRPPAMLVAASSNMSSVMRILMLVILVSALPRIWLLNGQQIPLDQADQLFDSVVAIRIRISKSPMLSW